MSIGFSGPSVNTYISCPSRSAETQIQWLFSPGSGSPQLLNTDSDPKLSLDRYTLIISNISHEYEGIYYCKLRYSDGSESSVQGAGCAFVAGEGLSISTTTPCLIRNTTNGITWTSYNAKAFKLLSLTLWHAE